MPENSGDDQTLPICLVCGDKSSGLHYGIYSCEGCKCFFRRSANGANVRPCKNEGLCEITIKTRGKCQGCRYSKCVSVGMVPDESPVRRRRSVATPKVKKATDKEQPAPVPCGVCGDNAYSLAYGINCCAGCKSFFRRSIDNGGVYKCREDQFCDISLKSRQRCKKCRYARCLAVGMDTSAVRRYDHETNTDLTQPQPDDGDDDEEEIHLDAEPEAESATDDTDCVICGDQAIGKHHGVMCCMDCKCFFARSVVKNLKYECLQDLDACSLLLNTKCKRCRFQKCLDKGMVRATRKFKKTIKSGMRLRPQGDDSDFSDLGFDSDEEELDLFTYLKLTKTDTDGEKKSDEEQSAEKPAEPDTKPTQNGAFSPDKDEPITNKLCEVCGDAAVGRSYNVMSCSACASFFRVTSKAEEDIECVCDEINDDITMEIRRKCPYCRYQKCLSAGMRRITLNRRTSHSPMKTKQSDSSDKPEASDNTANRTPSKFKVKMFNFNKLKKPRGRKDPAGDVCDTTPGVSDRKRTHTRTYELSEICAVCGDEADGYHYGAYCCMGCNCFFKRTLQKDLKYECVHDELACSLPIKGQGSKCKQCRILKCLSIGMRNIGKVKAARAKFKEKLSDANAEANVSQSEKSTDTSTAEISQSENGSADAEEKTVSMDMDATMGTPVTMDTDAEVAATMAMPVGPLCAVCGDEASGMRGAIPCCVDCRSFFYLVNSESISAIPDCPKEPKCDVDADVKSACTYCRYQKCIAVGMDKGVSPTKEPAENKTSKRPNEDKDPPSDSPNKKKSKPSPTKSGTPIKAENNTSVQSSTGNTEDTGTPDTAGTPGSGTPVKSESHGTSPISEWKGEHCVVCGDKSFSKSYRVDCCKSCKSFFRRSLTKYNNYRCRGFTKVKAVKQEGQCPVTTTNRKCSYCRFKMCRDKGLKSIELNDEPPERKPKPRKADKVKKDVVKLSRADLIKRKWLLQDLGDSRSSTTSDSSSLPADGEDMTNITSMPIMLPSGEVDEISVNMSQDSGMVLEPENSLQWNTEPSEQLDMLRRAMENLKDATTVSEGSEDNAEEAENSPDQENSTNNTSSENLTTESNHEAILENFFNESKETPQAVD